MKKLFTIIILAAMLCGLVALSAPKVSMAIDLGSGIFNTPSPSDDTTGGTIPRPPPPSPN